ncbi:AAA family ATPase [Aestuariivirga sp.]|uniref:AAA family ATPase n=1 Tax=Aestuariivirga sp. TaxID=2650926 RepID=UPI003BABD4BC
MKLTHVSVEGCGRFGKLTRVEGFGPGVNILTARNEAGKSTLFRAIRTCLFERHSSTKEDIEALATEGLSLPVTITVGFEKGGTHYEIRKSFLRSKSASLLVDGVERARNAQADQEVWELLGIEQRSARALDEAAYGMLWVAQGRSFEQPSPSEAAKGVLNAVVQQEVGTLVGGERARHLLNAVKEELGRYYTDRGPKAGGPVDTVAKEARKLAQDRLETEDRLAQLNVKLEELSTLRAEFRTASDPAALHALNEQLNDARARLAEAEKAGEDIRRLTAEERHAHERAEDQQGKLDTLKARAATIDAQRLRLEEFTAAMAPLNDENTAAAKALQEQTAHKTGLDAALEQLELELAGAQRLEALATRLSRRGELDARLRLLEAFRKRAAENEAALTSATVDDAAIKLLEAIEREDAKHRGALEAGAAQIAIEMKPGAAVRMNGGAISGSIARAVTEPMILEIGEEVTLTISPPASALGSSAARALEAEREKLNALLMRHGVATAAELRQRRGVRIELEEIARDIRAERSALAIKEDLNSEIERLRTAVSGIESETQRVLGEGAALPSPEESDALKRNAAERRNGFRAQRAACESRIKASTDALQKLAAARGEMNGQIEALRRQLEQDLSLLPDATRENAIAGCAAELQARRDTHRIKAAALSERQAHAPPPGEAERLASRIERLTQAIGTQGEVASRLREAIARIEGEVENAGGEGLGERAATLKIQHEMLQAEEARLAERAEVLKLLRDTVESCYAERREQLNAPLQRHLTPFLHDVFPEASIALGENFAISGLSRAAPEGELFGRLSLGTQEQLAVLVRLAMGAMIAEKGAAVPVILDDALVFSDDARIEQMFDALNRAGKNQQVIVLTCRARSFTSLGGRQLRIV